MRGLQTPPVYSQPLVSPQSDVATTERLGVMLWARATTERLQAHVEGPQKERDVYTVYTVRLQHQ
jgi:hypothetical protein